MARTPKPSAHPEPTAPKRGRKKTRAGSSGSSSKDAAAGTEPSVDALPAPPAARKPRIRPTYSPAIAEEICRRLAEGEGLIAICRDEGMPAEATVRGWVIDDYEGMAAKYARARDMGLDRMIEETIDIADDSGLDVVMTEDGPRADGEVVQRAKLRVDTRRWIASKLAPKRYGDRLQVDATVSVEAMDDSELRATVMELAERLGLVGLPAIAKPEGEQ